MKRIIKELPPEEPVRKFKTVYMCEFCFKCFDTDEACIKHERKELETKAQRECLHNDKLFELHGHQESPIEFLVMVCKDCGKELDSAELSCVQWDAEAFNLLKSKLEGVF